MRSFWIWFDKHYKLNLTLTAAIFALQIVHLLWLLLDVIWLKVFGYSVFTLDGLARYLVVAVDYTEIPSLISVSLLYIHHLRKQFNWKEIFYLIFLNLQWIHLFWITDEFVVNSLSETTTLASDGHAHSHSVLPAWLAFVAILIDYLELPVMYDVFKKVIKVFRSQHRTTAGEYLAVFRETSTK